MGQGGLVKCVQHSRPNSNVGQSFNYDAGSVSMGEMANTDVIGDLSAIHCCLASCDGKPNNNATSNFQILGSPIGSDIFITYYLHQQVFPKLNASIDAIALPITHLMRTIPPHVVTGFLQRHAQQQLALPLNLCDFGLSNTDINAVALTLQVYHKYPIANCRKPTTSWNMKPPGSKLPA
ncbi:hypothetical protein GJ496_009594 [Pomphorhynchus laevis]|nr:hypothetical protein GJ496_009594 [Pomphorhynchus laevis]